MNGILLYVMGPSGSGKDSLIACARRAMHAAYAQTWDAAVHARRAVRPVFFIRRHITRPAEAGGEAHRPLTREEFQQRKAGGAFALSWESHGLCYGVGREMDAFLAQGALVVVNGSRDYLPEAMILYPALTPALITVRPDILRARLEKRGRESAAAIDERLATAAMALPDIPGLIALDNSGSLADAGQNFTDVCDQLRERLPDFQTLSAYAFIKKYTGKR